MVLDLWTCALVSGWVATCVGVVELRDFYSADKRIVLYGEEEMPAAWDTGFVDN